MARPKKEYQTPIIEKVVEDLEETVEVTKVAEVVKKEEPQQKLIPLDGTVISRKMPTMEVNHVVGKLVSGRAYKIKKTVNSVIYGEFYLLENGLYVSKVGNFVVRE